MGDVRQPFLQGPHGRLSRGPGPGCAKRATEGSGGWLWGDGSRARPAARRRTASTTHGGYEEGVIALLDVHIFVSGDVWQHDRSGVQLGSVGRKSRSLWIRIYVPDDVETEEEARCSLVEAFAAASERVRRRLELRGLIAGKRGLGSSQGHVFGDVRHIMFCPAPLRTRPPRSSGRSESALGAGGVTQLRGRRGRIMFRLARWFQPVMM